MARCLLLAAHVGDDFQHLAKVIFGQEPDAEELDKVLSNNDFKTYFFGHSLKTCSEDVIPECKDNAVITVMLPTGGGVMRAMERRRD